MNLNTKQAHITIRHLPLLQSKFLNYCNDISQLFQPFSKERGAILLDSGKPCQKQGEFDIFSAWPSQSVAIKQQQIIHTDTDHIDHKLDNLEDLIHLLNQSCQLPYGDLPFAGGWLGFSHFELTYFLEKKHAMKTSDKTLFWAGHYEWAVIQNHTNQTCQLVWQDNIDPSLLNKIENFLNKKTHSLSFHLFHPFKAQLNFSQYQIPFDKIQDYIQAGDCYQVNFAFAFESEFQGDEFAAYQQLRKAVPSPFMAYIHAEQESILSISPEQFIQIDKQTIQSKPIKGTAPRSADSFEDKQLAENLLTSTKNRAENIMIVDLIRNDLGKLCQAGSVKVEKLCALESFSNVHHLVSTISGQLKPEITHWHSFFKSFPGGSITGAPKIRAWQIIQELESSPRGIYCGSIFMASDNQRFNSNLCIRTLSCQGNHITAFAGGGIVADSKARDEYQECFNKIEKLMQSLPIFC